MGVGADARPEGGLPDCGEGATNGERVVLALPKCAYPPFPLRKPQTLTQKHLCPQMQDHVLQKARRCSSVRHLLMGKGCSRALSESMCSARTSVSPSPQRYTRDHSCRISQSLALENSLITVQSYIRDTHACTAFLLSVTSRVLVNCGFSLACPIQCSAIVYSTTQGRCHAA